MASEQPTHVDPVVDRKQKLGDLKDRLAKYKLKNELVTQRELEQEAKLIEKEKLDKETQVRLEAEKQALVEELQKATATNTRPVTLPQTMQLNAQQQLIQQQQQQQQQLQLQLQLQQQQQQQLQPQQPVQSFFGTNAFAYPAIITEKEAIDWLRNGL